MKHFNLTLILFMVPFSCNGNEHDPVESNGDDTISETISIASWNIHRICQLIKSRGKLGARKKPTH
jgi:hypothetical protein